MSSRVGLAVRAFPTLLRIGLAEAVAYRAEMLVWMLSTTMPLVNLALWHALARSGPIGRFGQPELVAYFLASFIVRQVTGSWVVWEMNMELRSGRFSMRLLRPVHPMLGYAAENLAALPLRMLISLPVALLALIWVGASRFSDDPVVWLCVALSLFGAWLIMFLTMALMGTMGFFLESSVSLVYVWQAFFFAASGYVFPIELLAMKAPRVAAVVRLLPFYYQNGFPIELVLGHHDRAAALRGLGIEMAYVVGLLLLLAWVWRLGIRRWNAYGA
jgi:ABC-2 type transport system permease protein